MNRSTILMNFAHNIGEGGGIINFGTLEIVDSTFEKNEDGINTILGGAALSNWGDTVITGSTLSDNGHLTEQDAIFTQGTLSMTNSTISNSGWDAINNDYGDVYLNYVTIAYNTSLGMSGSSGHWYVTNSLIAFNGRGDCSPNLPLASPASSFIMDSDGTCGGLTAPGEDIRLAPLGNYGGLTETHALLPGSAAIDITPESAPVLTHYVPGCIPLDQRGEARPFGAGCDLGAFEFRADPLPPLPPVGLTATFTPTRTSTLTPSASLPVLLPPPTLTASPTVKPVVGCTVSDLTTGFGVRCVVPCPAGAVPGAPCTP
jgi:hypothetical protein